jgi:hypothetical protein
MPVDDKETDVVLPSTVTSNVVVPSDVKIIATTEVVEKTSVVHLIPTIPVTIRRQIHQFVAALTGGIGAVLSFPPDSFLPHLTALFGDKAQSWGPLLMAIAFFWNAFTKGVDISKLNQANKSPEIKQEDKKE